MSLVEWDTWDITPDTFGKVLLAWIYARLVMDIAVCSMQAYADAQHREIPVELIGHVTQETFEKARKYRYHKILLEIVSYLYLIMVIDRVYVEWGSLYKLWNYSGAILDFLGIWPSTWNTEIGWTLIFIIIGTLFYNSFEVPIRFINAFVVEQWHGFNRQTLWFFVKDAIKRNLIEISIAVPIGLSVVLIVQLGGQFFYIWLWLVAFGSLVFIMAVYPNWIAPLFDVYVPLRPGQLRDRLTRLAEECNFPVEEILIVKLSKRSSHTGAYFYGFSRVKRIVLSDNLLKRYLIAHPNEDEAIHLSAPSRANFAAMPEEGNSEQEIEALVAHEIGHWKLGHVYWDLGLVVGNLFVFFIVFSYFYKYSVMYEAFSFPKQSKKPIILGLFIVVNNVLDTITFATGLIMRKFSRYFELKADEFAVSKGYGEVLKQALLKLYMDNLSYPYFNPSYTWYFQSRPPVLKRLRKIDEVMRKRQ